MKFLAFIVLCFVTETTLVFAANDVEDLKQYLLGTGDMIRIQVYKDRP